MVMIGLNYGECGCGCEQPPTCTEPAAPTFWVQTNIDPPNHYVVAEFRVPCSGSTVAQSAILWCTGFGSYARDSNNPGDVPVSITAVQTGAIDTDFPECYEYRVQTVTVDGITYDYETGEHTPDNCGECIGLSIDGDWYTRRRFRVGDQPVSITISMDLGSGTTPACFAPISGTSNVTSFTTIDGWIVAGTYTYAPGFGDALTVSWRNFSSCQCSVISPPRCRPGTLHEFPFAWSASFGGPAGIPFASWDWAAPGSSFDADHQQHNGNGILTSFCCEMDTIPISGQCIYEISFDAI